MELKVLKVQQGLVELKVQQVKMVRLVRQA
jgi:hypothetical protein